jgi:hypothetical protein
MELVHDDVIDRHPKRAILPRVDGHPPIGVLGNLIEIGRKHHQLRPVVTRFRREMHIGRARHAHVRSHRRDELRVEPVGAFRHIRLLAPHFGAGGRQVAVPIVKTHAHRAQHLQETASARITQHGHGGDGRESDDAVGSIFFDRVHRGCGDDSPTSSQLDATEAALAARLMKGLAPRFILNDGCPRFDRVFVLSLAFRHRSINTPRIYGYFTRIGLY